MFYLFITVIRIQSLFESILIFSVTFRVFIRNNYDIIKRKDQKMIKKSVKEFFMDSLWYT